jgi:hypothetical protein
MKPAAVFVGLAAALFLALWPTIASTGPEIGDYAANSLLIQDAKSFRLLVGNYSRAGFNHPGPAFLYVLAAGEVAAHDWLGIVTPIGGQIIAAGMLSAGWLTAIGMIVWRHSSFGTAAIFVAVIVWRSTFTEPHVFGGLWFPYLYYLPFAAFTVALASAIAGRAHALSVLAVSAGFLVNGHVSFIPITAMMGAAGLAAHAALRPAGGSWLDRAFWSSSRREIITACVLLALFFVPLVIETALHFPGPVPLYLKFAETPSNTASDAALFVAGALGDHGAIGAAVLAVALCVSRRSSAPLAMAAALAAAVVAVFVYAKTGIDDLHHGYVVIFFSAVPAVAAALIAAIAYGAVTALRPAPLAVIPLVAWACAPVLSRVPPFIRDYNDTQIEGIYQRLRGADAKLAVNIDPTSGDWEALWTRTAGLLLIAKRRGVDLMCVRAYWTLALTKAARCSDTEPTAAVITGPRNKVDPATVIVSDDRMIVYRP